jgi:putative FmdB family regulatory protein
MRHAPGARLAVPRYDYICQNGHIVEVMHGVNDPGPARCERCGTEMRKLLSTPSIVFKGSGWAKKDRSTKPATKAKGTTDNEAKPSTSSDGQSTKSGTDSTGSGSSGSSTGSGSSGSSGGSGSSDSGSSGSDSDG